MESDLLCCSVDGAANDASYVRPVPVTPVRVMAIVDCREIRSRSATELFMSNPYSGINDIDIYASACRVVDVLLVQVGVQLVNSVEIPERVCLCPRSTC